MPHYPLIPSLNLSLIVIHKLDKDSCAQQKILMRKKIIFAIFNSINSVEKHYGLRGQLGFIDLQGRWGLEVKTGVVEMAIAKPKGTRSLMWYVDLLIVAGVIGVVVALAVINYHLV